MVWALVLAAVAAGLQSCATKPEPPDEWRAKLSPLAYAVLRKGATELAFTGKYHKHLEPGMYRCAGCNQDLFSSLAKFDSRTGWPSFWAPVNDAAVTTRIDGGREEIRCSRCGGHLGHVFPDGPEPTRLRYCVNSAALRFESGSRAAHAPSVSDPGSASRR